VALVVLATAVVGCWGFATPDSAFTVVNRTTVPVVVEDDGSVSVVAACSERTLDWHNTWGVAIGDKLRSDACMAGVLIARRAGGDEVARRDGQVCLPASG
jgi:hypothetical protein